MRVKRKRMGIDVDEVLADFQGSVLTIANDAFGLSMKPGDLPTWEIFSHFPEDQREFLRQESKRSGFCSALAKTPGSAEAVKELRKYVDLYAVTAHYDSHTWVSERDWWLKSKFQFERNQIIHTQAKFLVGVDIFLDDKPSNVVEWKQEHPNGLAMLWTIPNNVNYDMDRFRVHSWDDVIRLVADFKVTK